MNLYHRFLSKVDVREADECWPWKGRPSKAGYGIFRICDGVTRYAHRMSFMVHHQRPPASSLLHSCDNPLCVNPAHLSEGTHEENMTDMVIKGRGPGRVLTNDQTRDIIRRRESGERATSLAAEFGVCRSSIYKIANREHHYARRA